MLKIGIVCAVDGELEPFLAHIEDCTESEAALLKIYNGNIHGMSVAALYSGVCKVNAAIAAQILIDRYGVDLIINCGVAGGMSDDVDILDTIVSTEITYHDVAKGTLTEYHPWMESEYFSVDLPLIEIAKNTANNTSNKILFGRIVTGETFITNKNRDIIIDAFHPLAVDMESGAIAHVCYTNRIPFIAVRTVTDNSKHDGQDHFEKNFTMAASLSCKFTLAFLDNLYNSKGLF